LARHSRTGIPDTDSSGKKLPFLQAAIGVI
jgi:hypothetical protein